MIILAHSIWLKNNKNEQMKAINIFIHSILFTFLYISSSCNQQSKKNTLSKQDTVDCISPPSRIVSVSKPNTTTLYGKQKDTVKMIWISGGVFEMGSNAFADAQPIHQVKISGFWIDEHEVSNAQFAAFVKATGYKTVAERPLNPTDFPGVAADKLVPGSAVFTPPSHKVNLDNPLQWWRYISYANWQQPEGVGSSIKNRMNEPVVHVCYEDAAAYAAWVGKRLPTEAEWEFAARGKKKYTDYYWGNDLKPGGKWVANIFQGHFPENNTKEDGYAGVAPVKTFPPEENGLYDMNGNVWDWCSDYYRPDYYQTSVSDNPQGPPSSFDPDEPGVVKRVQRGGSFLCSDEYCVRYKAGSRGKGEVNSSSNNVGFRCVKAN
jgi:formylglycine-generating enzyme required for sulfatase activity